MPPGYGAILHGECALGVLKSLGDLQKPAEGSLGSSPRVVLPMGASLRAAIVFFLEVRSAHTATTSSRALERGLVTHATLPNPCQRQRVERVPHLPAR